MSRHETIGVVGGYGDLGRRLVAQALTAYERVLIFDLPTAPPVSALYGVDPELYAKVLQNSPVVVENLDELVQQSNIVHWAAPLGRVVDLGTIDEQTLLILHDSVMSNSVNAEHELNEIPTLLGEIAIVHCFMNDKARVVVASEGTGAVSAMDHFTEMGLSPKYMTTKEHDIVMANSQGAFALEIFSHYQLLKEYQDDGLLTPSSSEFLKAMEARVSMWTPETFKSILSNPELITARPFVPEAIDDFVKAHYN